MTLDPWSVTVDMGSFDLIVYESLEYLSVKSYQDNCQHLYRLPLVLMLRSQAREILEDWSTIAFCHGAEVRQPGKAGERNK